MGCNDVPRYYESPLRAKLKALKEKRDGHLRMADALDSAIDLMAARVESDEIALNPSGPFRHPKARSPIGQGADTR